LEAVVQDGTERTCKLGEFIGYSYLVTCPLDEVFVPTVLIEGYKFRFYSSDFSEPPHVHVLRDEHQAKIWLAPIALVYNHGFNTSELNRILRLTGQNQVRLLEVWNEYFSH